MAAEKDTTAVLTGIDVSKDDPSDVFEVLVKLGVRARGSVYKALDKRDGKIVAIKVFVVRYGLTSAAHAVLRSAAQCAVDHGL